MFQQTKLPAVDFRAEYAEQSDFCDMFEREMQTFYLMVFLLTANHKQAEQVFALTLEQALKEQSVFKGWARSWIKRALVKNAIGMIRPTSAGSGGERELWGAGTQGVAGEDEINAFTLLPALQRFVFVMSILERYSAWECSVLLGCTVQKVVRSRSQALRELPWPAQFHSRPEQRLPYLEHALT